MKSNVLNNPHYSLETAMKAEKEAMKTTVNGIEDRVPTIRKNIEAIKATSESLGHKEEDLDDKINDTFDQLVALLEQRRTCLLNQLHFRIASKREKLGRFKSKLNIRKIFFPQITS